MSTHCPHCPSRALLVLLPALLGASCGSGLATAVAAGSSGSDGSTVFTAPPTLEIESVERYTLSPAEVLISFDEDFETVEFTLSWREGDSGPFAPATLVEVQSTDEQLAQVGADPSQGGLLLHYPNQGAVEGSVAQPQTLEPADFGADDDLYVGTLVFENQFQNDADELSLFWDFETDLGDATLNTDLQLRLEYVFAVGDLEFTGADDFAVPVVGNRPILAFAEYVPPGADFLVVLNFPFDFDPPTKPVSGVVAFAFVAFDENDVEAQWFSFQPRYVYTDENGDEQSFVIGTEQGGTALINPNNFSNQVPTNPGSLIFDNAFTLPWLWNTEAMLDGQATTNGRLVWTWREEPQDYFTPGGDPGMVEQTILVDVDNTGG